MNGFAPICSEPGFQLRKPSTKRWMRGGDVDRDVIVRMEVSDMSTSIPRRTLHLVTFFGLALNAGERHSAADLAVDLSGRGDHRTIQAAVDAARDGGTIRIVPGRYRGSGDVEGTAEIACCRFNRKRSAASGGRCRSWRGLVASATELSEKPCPFRLQSPARSSYLRRPWPAVASPHRSRRLHRCRPGS